MSFKCPHSWKQSPDPVLLREKNVWTEIFKNHLNVPVYNICIPFASLPPLRPFSLHTNGYSLFIAFHQLQVVCWCDIVHPLHLHEHT